MSGLSVDNPQSNADRQHYLSMVRNAIQAQNQMHTGDIDNTIQSFGALYAMREEMDGQVGFGKADMYVHDKSGGFLPLVFAPAYYGLKKLFGGENSEIHIDIDSHKGEPNDDEEPKGGEMNLNSDDEKQGGMSFLELAMPGYALLKKVTGGEKADEQSGGMVLSPEAQAYHKKLAGRKPTKKAVTKSSGGRAPTGADFSGADVVNSVPLKNQGPDVGTKAKLGDKVPNTNAGAGVQTWTEYPNKNLSNEDIKEATATVRDVQNDFPVANAPSSEQVYNSIMKLARGKRQFTERSIGGAIKKKSYSHLSKIPASKLVEYIQAGKNCGGNVKSSCGGELKKKIEEDIKQGGFFGPLKAVMSLGDTVSKISDNPIVDKVTQGISGLFGLGKPKLVKKRGGAAVASPDIDEGKRASVVAGINEATQIDGFQDPRTTGLASQAGVGATLGGKKHRVRKPMTPEQKRLFAQRMALAKLNKRKQY
jgi:hypothetical protein